MTIIDRAKDLEKKIGNKAAIEVFEKEISEMGEIITFEQTCFRVGKLTAIAFLKGEIKTKKR